MNQNLCKSNSPGFDQPQLPQSLVIHQPPQEMSIQETEDTKQQYLDEMKRLSNFEYRNEIKIAELKENFNESDEVIQSSVENLILIPSESEGIPEQICDVPFHDNSPPLDVSKDQFEDFSESNNEFSSIDDDSFSIDNIDYVESSPPDSELVSSEVMEIVIPEVGGIDDDILLTIKDDILHENLLNVNHLFAKIEALNANLTPFYDPIISGTPPTLTSSRESDFFLESCSDEDVLEKIVSKPLFEEEIIPMKIDPHPDKAVSNLMESLRTHDSSLPISSKIDSFLDEFTDIRLIEKLLYDNSSPHLPEEFVFANSDAEIESFFPSLILFKDSDSLMEEIDLSCTPDYPMSPSIEDDDYDSERDILILKDLPGNNTLSFAKKSHSILIFLCFHVLLQNHQMEKSLDLLSHQGLKAFQPSAKCPMMIHG
nr:hypothetical protein [Tanacetum cinerariifolium]